jgi:hypothetical protein
VEDHKFRLTIAASPGRTYTLEAAADPSGPWTALASTRALETSLDFEDPNLASKRFYRIRVR